MPNSPARMGRPNQVDEFAPPASGHTYFLGIGINDYRHFTPLRNAVRDVRTIAQLLIDQYGINEDLAIFLFNKQATRANIINAFEKLSSQIKETDNLIIYYAGHGHTNERQRGFWIPVEAQKNSIDTYLRNSTIKDYIGDIDSLHTLLISDACFSGTLFVRAQRDAELTVRELMRTKSRWAICSGRDNETVADGPEDGHSPFAQSIIDVLRDTERPYIQTRFLISQVIEQTRANYQQVPDGGALSNVGHKRGQYVFQRRLQENTIWERACTMHSQEAYQNYLSHFPKGNYVNAANEKILQLKIDASKMQLESTSEDTIVEISQKLRLLRKAIDAYPESADFLTYLLAEGQRLEDKRDFLHVYDSEFRLRKFVLRDTAYRTEAQDRLRKLLAKQKQESDSSSPPSSIRPLAQDTSTSEEDENGLKLMRLPAGWKNTSLLQDTPAAYAYVDIKKEHPRSILGELLFRDRFIKRLQHFAFLDHQARQVVKRPIMPQNNDGLALIFGQWSGSEKTGHSLILERLVPVNKPEMVSITNAQNQQLKMEGEYWKDFFREEQLSLLGYLELNSTKDPGLTVEKGRKLVSLLPLRFQLFAELETGGQQLIIYPRDTQNGQQIDWHHTADISLSWEAFDQWLKLARK